MEEKKKIKLSLRQIKILLERIKIFNGNSGNNKKIKIIIINICFI